MVHAASSSDTLQSPGPSPAPRAARLDLLVVVPADSDSSPWIRARNAVPGADCSVILALPRGGAARTDDPGVETVFSPLGTSIFHLWESAIRGSSGTYVAVLDARCPPAATWFDGVRRALAEGVPAFFGPVTFPPDGDGQALVEYVLEYGQFARPLGADRDEVPGNNLVFRRDLLLEEDLRDQQFQKVFFVERLKRAGRTPAYRDDVEILYRKQYRRPHYLRRRFAHGRTYAALRLSGKGAGFRVLRAMTSPALPLLRLLRIARAVRGKPSLWAALLRHPAYALAAETAWSLGECAGYATGMPGDTAFLD